MYRRSACLLGLVLLSAAVRAGTEKSTASPAFKVVVNAGNATAAVSRQELSAIFLGRVTQWPDGTRAAPVDQVPSSPVRLAFSRSVHGRKPSSVKNYWMQMLFSGRGVPPVEKADDEAVLADVRARRGAVGYVSASARSDGVKVLEVRP